ncbi:MAG: GHKL domain-containing protein [Spirochaetales bacterium]|nr:GHKL domain-containing protein [Spirochaetales bacterium]
MKDIYVPVILFFCCMFLLSILSCTPEIQIKAERGELDLSSWDFEKNGIVELDGEWEFYWKEILYSNDFKQATVEKTPDYRHVPSLWNTYRIHTGVLPVTGYATYRLFLTLPDSHRLYAFKIYDQSTAYRLYIYGKYIMGNGKVGKTKEESIPVWRSTMSVFMPESTTIEIILHISNFHFNKPGFWKSISFGPDKQIIAMDMQSKAWVYLVLGIYLAIGTYHLVLFFLGKKDKATLFFGFFCLIFIIRSVFTDERIALSLFPWINWHAGLLGEILSVYYLVIFFILFLKALYPEEMISWINRIIIIISVIISLILLFTPSILINVIHSYYLIIILFVIIYAIIVLLFASIRKRTGAIFLFIGFLLFSVTIFYDILVSQFIINLNFLAPLGILFFIFTEFTLYVKFIKAEDELREREKELLHAEKLASLGTLIAGVAHEINNPNASIYMTTSTLSTIWKDLIPQLDEFAEKEGNFTIGNLSYTAFKEAIPVSLNRIKKNSKRIEEIVKDLKDYAKKDESNQDNKVNINNVINSSLRLLDNLIKKSTGKLELDLMEHLPPVQGNAQRLEQVIINIIQNACHALEDKQKGIFISTGFNEAAKKVIISIMDEGIGMDKKTLKQIYDPFFTTKRLKGGTGLGMAVTSRIVKDHGGELMITSRPGKGTTVEILLNSFL